jgi:hypothetical protein
LPLELLEVQQLLEFLEPLGVLWHPELQFLQLLLEDLVRLVVQGHLGTLGLLWLLVTLGNPVDLYSLELLFLP